MLNETGAKNHRHIWTDLAKPLKEGDTVPLTLTFEDKTGKKQTVVVKAPVRALGK